MATKSTVRTITTTSLPSAIAAPDRSSPTPSLAYLPTKKYSAFQSFRHRNYRLYFFGQIISFTGSWIQTTAQMWLVYQMTEQSAWPAAILAAQVLPAFVLGVWGGAIAERWPKRTLLFCTQSALLLLAVLLGVLVELDLADRWTLFFLAAASGIVNALDFPARLAFVMDMVGREDLVNAVALNSLLFNVARTVGPWLGGELLLWMGAGPCFLLNGVSYVAVLLALASMDIRESTPIEHHGGIRAILAAFRYVIAKPELAGFLVLAGIMSLFGWPFMALLPAMAHAGFGGEARAYSSLLCGTGIGALLAALTVASFGSLSRRRPFVVAGCTMVMAAFLGLSLMPSLIMAIFCCALMGYGLVLFFATSQAVVHLSADNHNRGRILGIWSMVLCGALPLGNLLSGRAADHWGLPFTLLSQGLACGILSLAVLLLFVWWSQRDAKIKGID